MPARALLLLAGGGLPAGPPGRHADRRGMAAIAGDILQLILIIGVMFYTDWRLAAISLSTIPLMLFSTYVFKEKIKKSFNEVRTAVANLNSFVQEHITGMNIVQIFGSEKIEAEKFRAINAEHRNAGFDRGGDQSEHYAVTARIDDFVVGEGGAAIMVWLDIGAAARQHQTVEHADELLDRALVADRWKLDRYAVAIFEER